MISVGTRVYVCESPYPGKAKGTVVEHVGIVNKDVVLRVELDMPHCFLHYTPKELTLLCINCDEPRKAHANNKKCLFSPTYWEGPTP